MAAATVTVTVTCTSGTDSDMASAKFKANPAPVSISGFDDASAPAGDADSVEVSEDFDVTPADARCTVTPAAASVSPTTGGTRTVSLEVDKGATASVTLTCSKDGASHRVHAKFAATRFDGCTSSLGTFGSGGVTVRAAISSAGGCKSVRRHDETGRTSYARWHTLKLASPGWVTVTLRSAASNGNPLDVYLLILQGAAANGSGKRLAFNDDHRSELTLGKRDSLIARYFLAAGTYTIEATTYGWLEWHQQHDVEGDYVLHVNVDHTPAASQPTSLRVKNGTTATSTWGYQPATASAKLASSFPDGLTASLDASGGRAKLAVTPSEVGQYAVLVTYSNGPETLTKSTTVTSYCPTGQSALPGDCATPLLALDPRSGVQVGPLPAGYEQSKSCYATSLNDDSTVYTCRKLRKMREYISKASPLIKGESTVHGDYGTALLLEGDQASVLLEGCQSVTEEFWQCDYRAESVWSRQVETVSEGRHLLNVLWPWLFGDLDTYLEVLSCATATLELWGSGLRDAQAWASALTSCPQAVEPMEPRSGL